MYYFAATWIVVFLVISPTYSQSDSKIEAAIIHPFTDKDYMCSEHYENQLPYIGDALGSDCLITGFTEDENGRLFATLYQSNGYENEDWYGWNMPVLAPFDGNIVQVNVNDIVNEPGILGKGRASAIIFERADGTRVIYAHLREIAVAVGDSVKAGQVVANIGNNGFARSPHIHIGAWLEGIPLQIRFDLKVLGAIRSED